MSGRCERSDGLCRSVVGNELGGRGKSKGQGWLQECSTEGRSVSASKLPTTMSRLAEQHDTRKIPTYQCPSIIQQRHPSRLSAIVGPPPRHLHLPHRRSYASLPFNAGHCPTIEQHLPRELLSLPFLSYVMAGSVVPNLLRTLCVSGLCVDS